MTPGLAMVMSMAACGSEQASSSPGNSSATTSVAPSGSPNATLTVQVKASAKAPAKTWTLSCDPAGGDHPKASQACTAVTQAKDPFKPPPADQMCTKIYGGPEIATVKGTWQGKPVNAKFSRTDGCELSRWDKLAPLFGGVPKVG
ncbi:SSI family serine proteinase inhibitor [Spirillospora sp. NPDC048911]|uniref:SSI family serine proteinase inhibitor n=1 Tax=Spirillospora sp. NPDC048911 TaxID=3364527 RepID=UPI00371AE1C5